MRTERPTTKARRRERTPSGRAVRGRLRSLARALAHPAVRPAPAAPVALAIAACLLVLGAETASIALIAGACALAIALGAGLVSALAGWAEDGQGGPDRPDPLAAGGRPPRRAGGALRAARRLLAARVVAVTTSWTQLDQHGRVIAAFEGDGEPTSRGLYRAGSRTVRRRDAFGFWATRRTAGAAGELWVAPDAAGEPPQAVRDLVRRPRGQRESADRERIAALVRPYEKGDPLRAIAWRQSAHHGALMSFDPERTRRALPLVAVDALGAEDIDRLAAEVACICSYLARRPGSQGEVVLTDGISRVRGTRSIARFAAALQPDAAGPARRAQQARRRARNIRAQALRGRGARWARPVILVTGDADGDLARALAAELGDGELVVAPVRAGREAPSAAPERERAQDGARRDGARRPRTERAAHGAACPERPLPSDLASLACAVALLLETFALLGTLIEPGAWSAFGPVVLGAVACEAVLGACLPGMRTRGRRIACALAALALVALASIVGAACFVHGATGIWVFSETTPLVALGIKADGGGLGWIVPLCARGVYALYWRQWVPVSVGPVSDAALILLMVPVAAALRLLLASRRTRPLIALLPLALQAVAFVFMGAASDPVATALALSCGLALRALGERDAAAPGTAARPLPRTGRAARAGGAGEGRSPASAPRAGRAGHGAQDPAARPPSPPRRAIDAGMRARSRDPRALARAVRLGALAASIAIAVLACAASGPATQAAQRLPIRLGFQSNLLAGSTVNPIMDLKADLTRPAETVAFTYGSASDRPLYFRLATLGDLTADTWTYGYEDDPVPTNPLASLLSGAGDAEDRARALPGPDENPSPVVETVLTAGTTAVAGVRALDVHVSIEALASRFAPLPLGAYGTEVRGDAGADGTGSGWYWAGDGTVESDSSVTNRGQAYDAQAAYMVPVTGPDGLQGVIRLANALRSRSRADGDGGTAEARYLQLPDGLPDEIQQVVDGARASGAVVDGDGDAADARESELAALSYLLTYFSDPRFTYALDAPDGDGRDNYGVIARFLETGRGYCLHYASAFGVLGRALGVPTRIALGYRAGSSRAADGSRAATNRDLHAWCEAYVYGIGWVPFDVTPGQGAGGADDGPAGPVDAEGADPTADAGTPETPDAAEEPETPQDTGTDEGQGAGDGDGSAPTGGGTASDPLRPLLAQAGRALAQAAPAVAGAALILLAALSPRLIRRIRRASRMRAVAHAGARPGRAAEAAWRMAADRARSLGAAWDGSATEEQVARAMAERLPYAADEIGELESLVCRARYGAQPPRIDPDRLRGLLRALDDPDRR